MDGAWRWETAVCWWMDCRIPGTALWPTKAEMSELDLASCLPQQARQQEVVGRQVWAPATYETQGSPEDRQGPETLAVCKPKQAFPHGSLALLLTQEKRGVAFWSLYLSRNLCL